ncbi:hypothetical protein F220043C3_10580 [Enterocloster asparagiformis]
MTTVGEDGSSIAFLPEHPDIAPSRITAAATANLFKTFFIILPFEPAGKQPQAALIIRYINYSEVRPDLQSFFSQLQLKYRCVPGGIFPGI